MFQTPKKMLNMENKMVSFQLLSVLVKSKLHIKSYLTSYVLMFYAIYFLFSAMNVDCGDSHFPSASASEMSRGTEYTTTAILVTAFVFKRKIKLQNCKGKHGVRIDEQWCIFNT